MVGMSLGKDGQKQEEEHPGAVLAGLCLFN